VPAIAFLLPCLAGVSQAQQGGETDDGALALDPIIVVAGRMTRPLSEVAAQVTVIDASDMRQGLVEDLDGLLKYEPGLEVPSAGTRFGSTGVNIRGIGGNRVQFEIDGVPARDTFAIGAYSNGSRTLVEPDRVKRVEVLYGPASAMYGSRALGGVMSVYTWNPSDLLVDARGAGWFGLRGGWQGADESWVVSGVGAWGEGAHGLLAAATYRNGHQVGNQAPPGTPTDPQDWDSTDFMFRYAYDTDAGNRLRLTADAAERDTSTTVYSQLGYGRRFRWTTALQGDDHDQSRRLSLDYDFSAGGWQQGNLRVFALRHDTDQYTRESRTLAPQPVEIERRFQYGQDLYGVDFMAVRATAWGEVSHRVGLGAEWLRTDVSELRDGTETRLNDGSTSNEILGESMPVRDFPNSRTDEYALWIQDEIEFPGGRWEWLPALRWDAYDLDPEPDDIWLEDNPDTPVVPVDESRVTPRLGVVFNLAPAWNLYGQYSEGFRAPPFEDANLGFNIPLLGYRALPNPDLKSETSRGYEFGIRRFSAAARYSLAYFHTDFEDFIESRVLIGRDPDTGDLLFQSRNIDEARIQGVDLRLDQDLYRWADALDGWTLNLAALWTTGQNRQTGEPINSVSPPQAILGIGWLSPAEAWDVHATGTFTARKKPRDIDETDGERFATPAWTRLDLTAGWRPADWVEIRAGVFNLLDKTYWRWLDVSNLEADDPVIPLLSQPGRNVSVTIQLSF
jgi:hemoglobin/transferrin/lactoferrin receptor protein